MAKKKTIESGIYNIDLLEFFKTGKRNKIGEPPLRIDGNILYVEDMLIAVKSGNFTMLNGDDNDLSCDAESVRDELQPCSAKEITTSFECLKNAGLSLESIKVIHSTEDLRRSVSVGSKGFKDFEKTVPQGATYSEYVAWNESKPNQKSYHRAGSMLIEYKGTNYICGMDDDSYFVSKLSNHPKSVEGAFKSLKPKRVNNYEKESGKQAKRQGEWFFIPVDMEADNMKHNYALPLQTKGGNKHIIEHYEESNGKHYCKGLVGHEDHQELELGDVLHEAIQSTALDSWSVQGVD